jgi:uncharacterized membrane protein
MFRKTQELILVSLFGAIILGLAMIPNVGLITLFGAVSITIIHIPVLIGAMTLKKLSSVVILGTLFGLGSLFAALTRGATPVDLAFVNPLISVIPRMLFAISAYYIFKSAKWFQSFLHYMLQLAILSIIVLIMSIGLATYLMDNNFFSITVSILLSTILFVSVIIFMYYQTRHRKNLVFIPVTSFLATLLHTFFVLSALVLVEPGLFNLSFGAALEVIYGIVVTNGLLEAVVAVLVVTPIVTALAQALKGTDYDPAL